MTWWHFMLFAIGGLTVAMAVAMVVLIWLINRFSD